MQFAEFGFGVPKTEAMIFSSLTSNLGMMAITRAGKKLK